MRAFKETEKRSRPARNRLLVFIETMGAQLLGALLSIVNVAVATHALSRPDAGAFFVLMGIAIIGGTIGSLGFASASAVLLGKALASREIDKVRGAAETMLMTLLAANILLGGLVIEAGQSDLVSTIFGVTLPRSHAVPVSLQLAGVALALASPAIALALGYARETAWLRYAIPNVLTLLCLGTSHWIFRPSLDTALWCYAIGFLTSGLAATLHAAWAAIRLAPQSNRPEVSKVLNISIPLTVTQLQVNLIDYGILWVAALAAPITDIALLGMAQRVATGSQIAFRSSVLLYMPAAARMFPTGQREELRSLSKATGFLTAAPSLILLVATLLFGRVILELAFGEQYADVWLPLALLFAGYAARGLAGPGEYLLQVTGRHYVVIVGNMLYLFVMTIATFSIARYGGATGVAAVVAVCTAVQQFAYFLLCRRWYGISVNATFRYSEIRRALTEIKI